MDGNGVGPPNAKFSCERVNTASALGGGIANMAYASLFLYDCDLHYNSAGINGGGIQNSGTAIISSTAIYVNDAPHGGGIYNASGADLTVDSGSQIYSNTGYIQGGGIENAGTLYMSNATLDTNYAGNEGSWGGGLYNASGTATLDTVSIQRNGAGRPGGLGAGGGIYVATGTVTATSCTIRNNRAAAANYTAGAWEAGATLTITNPINSNGTYGQS